MSLVKFICDFSRKRKGLRVIPEFRIQCDAKLKIRLDTKIVAIMLFLLLFETCIMKGKHRIIIYKKNINHCKDIKTSIRFSQVFPTSRNLGLKITLG